MATDLTYPPLDCLKPIAEAVWIVDGPVIRFGPKPFAMPFPTRMTVLRLAEGLFVHSPTRLTAELKAQVDRIGAVRWIVGPNRIHYWWIPDWHAAFPVAGRYMTEVEFFHRDSRTLILTDLIESFEPAKLSFFMRLMTRLGHVQHPDGQMPRDMRLTFDRSVLKMAVEQMLAWQPERIVIAHGRWFARDGIAELRRAFRWLLD